jgi:Protein of unknown function (DUF2380)/PEGA domain
MSRALSLTCVALLMVALGAASAMAKPMIAVLGLEVVDASGTPSAQDTQVAKELSDGLRARAKAGTGQYQLAPGSDKELIDQKLLNNCDTEAPACMAAIGNQLGAEILLFGKIQKEGKTSYQVTLKVLDVGRKTVQKSSTDLVPVSEASGAALQGWAKKIYAKLTGEQTTGMIVIKLTNAERGTILVDGEEKGNITNGTGQVANLAEGKYKVAVESDGFRRWDRDVTINAGQTNTIPVELEKGGGDVIGPGPGPGSSPGPGPEGKSGSGLWKGVFIGSMVVAAAGGGWWYVNYTGLKDIEDEQCRNGARGCPAPMTPDSSFDITKSNSDGDKKSMQTYVGGAVMGVGIAVAAFAFYKGFIASGSSSKESSTRTGARRGKARRERFIVTPIVAPDGGGATVRLDW